MANVEKGGHGPTPEGESYQFSVRKGLTVHAVHMVCGSTILLSTNAGKPCVNPRAMHNFSENGNWHLLSTSRL